MGFSKSTTLLVLLLLSLISTIKSASQPSTLQIQGTIFDQYPGYNNNFEPPGGSITTGLVQTTINSFTRVPTLKTLDASNSVNKNGRMVTPSLFEYFFQPNQNAGTGSNSGLNVPIAMTINLTLDSNKGVYVYDNQAFFPIDRQGFDVDQSFRKYYAGSTYHNFHFCLKLNTRFTYGGYETFNFIGDDDVWVFINEKLAVDLGGLHSRESKSIDLTTLGLTKNVVYTFDFFYCERHTTASTIRIETNIQVYCAFYDYCGVCSGDGSTCCNPTTACNDGNPCTNDLCPPATTVIESGKSIKDYCVHTDKSCPTIDACHTNSCNTTTGSCQSKEITCADRSNECLTLKTCDAANGCIYTPSCTGSCDTGSCNNGQCVQKTNSTCGDELNLGACRLYSCDSENGGCISEPLCKQGAVCTSPVCSIVGGLGVCSEIKYNETECECGCGVLDKCLKNNCVNGECSPLDIDGIDDGNACTEDICVDGVITHTPINKCGGCSKCNTKTGDCDLIASACDDGNECTDNICSIDSTNSNSNYTLGVCSNSTTSCTPTVVDICKVYTCDSQSGCQSSDLVCPDSGNCQVGFCDRKLGCQLKPRQCNSPAFCIVAECDELVGCVTFERVCASDDGKCQRGVCVNATETEEGECQSQDYDPLPFICKTAAVVSTAVVAGVVVAGAVALAAAIFGGKKGYDYWKESRNVSMSGSNSNPLYEQSQNAGVNPLYNDTAAN